MSLEVNVEHLGEHQFEIKARTHTVICDQPASAGGFDEGMTPPELMLASLGSCAGYYAAEYLRQHKLAEQGTHVRVTADKMKDPARLGRFVIDVDVPLLLNEQDRKGLERAIGRCLIHNTLTHPPEIGVHIAGIPEAAAA
jgi:uncharacterized OsmC-like protein